MKNLILPIAIASILAGCNGLNDAGKGLVMENIQKDTVFHIQNKDKNPALKIYIDVEMPTSYSDQTLLTLFQEVISKNLIGIDTISLNPSKAIKLYIDKWDNDYKSLEKDFSKASVNDTLEEYTTNINSFNWEVGLKGQTKYLGNNIISYLIENRTLLDGSSICTIYNKGVNISMINGKEIELNDIMIDDYEEMLLPCIIDKIKSINKLSSSDNLESIGYFGVDEICVSHNILIEEDGITFIYNQGEIAAKVIGNIKVKMSYDELAFVMKEDSPVSNFAN